MHLRRVTASAVTAAFFTSRSSSLPAVRCLTALTRQSPSSMPRKNPFSPPQGVLELNPASFPRLHVAAAAASSSAQQAESPQSDQENDAAAANRDGDGDGEAAAADGDGDGVGKPRRSRRGRQVAVKLEYEEDAAVKREQVEPAVKREGEAATKDEMKADDSHNSGSSTVAAKAEETADDALSATAAATHQHETAPPADLDNSPYPPPSKPGPPHWREVYAGIVHMRSDYSAPVDHSGCERQAYSVDAKHVRFQKLVGLMLSAQTKDAVTDEAVRRLDNHWKDRGGLTVANILTADEATIDSLICKVGFHSRKANFILRTARILRGHYGDDIPRTIPLLCSLPGVGPKMAFLAMQCAWHDNVGIGVDVHVHRIANRLGWVSSVEAEETREQMEDWLPRHLWPVINKLLVGFGQQICLPTTPRCAQCTINTHCPVGVVNVKRLARGLTPVKESKDEARVAAMKRAKKGGRKWTPVKYAKHDEAQPSLDAASSKLADDDKDEAEAGLEVPAEAMEHRAKREADDAEEQAERNAAIVADKYSAQTEVEEEKEASAMEARAESMETSAEAVQQSGRRQKRKSVRSAAKQSTDQANEEKESAPASISSRTRNRGRRFEM